MWIRETGIVDALGEITINLPSARIASHRHLYRIVVFCTSTTDTRFGLYETTLEPFNMIDGTLQGNDDVGLENPPLPITAGCDLVGHWTNVSALDALGNPSMAYLAILI